MATMTPKTAVFIVDEDGDYVGPDGLGGGTLVAAEYNATPPTIVDTEATSLQTDVNGKLLISGTDVTNSRLGIQYYTDPSGRILTEQLQAPPTANVNGIQYNIIWDPVTNAPAVVGTDLGIKSSGIVATASFTPAAAAYGAGDLLDVAKEFVFTYANGDPIPSASLIRILSSVTKIDVTTVPAGQTSYTLRAYAETPATSGQADNDAWALASADLTIYKGPLNLGTPVDEGAACYVKSQYLDTDIKLTGVSMFGRLVTVGAHTATAVARQVSLYGIVL